MKHHFQEASLSDAFSSFTRFVRRERHMNVTWIISSQCLNLVGPVVRKNVRCMCVWRLRNYKEIDALCEKLSGIYDKKTILELYRHATEEAYSFLFVRLDAKTRDEMFFLRFEKKLVPSQSDASPGDSNGRPLDGATASVQQVRSDRQGAVQQAPEHKPPPGSRH